MAEAATLDAALKTNVQKALKTEPATALFFALVMKGGAAGKLLLNKAKIQPKLIDEAKKETGGSAVIKGFCFGDKGTLVFETAKPVAPAVTTVTKTVLKTTAGMTVAVEYRLGRDCDAMPEAGAEAEAKFKARLAEVKKQVEQIKAADPARVQPLAGLLMQADSLGQAKEFADGMLRLDAVEAQLKSLAGAPATLESEYQARVKALTEDLKKAITTGTPAGNEAKLKFSESQMFSRKKDFAQALVLLKVVEEQIKKALASAPAADKTEAKPAPTPDPAAEWKKNLDAWTPAIKAAMTAKGPQAADISKLLAQATSLSKPGGDMALALAKLTECHDLAKKAAAPPAAATSPADPGADFKKKLDAWTPAIKAAMTAKGPQAADISKLLAQATSLSKPGGDMALALTKLTECHDLAKKSAAPPAAATSPAAPASSDQAAEWERRVTALEPKIRAAQKTRGSEAKWMTMFTNAQNLGSDGDFAKSFAILDQLEGLLNAAPAGGLSVMKLGKARLEWIKVREHAVAEFQRLKDILQEEYKDHPEEQAALAASKTRLDALVASINEELGEQLDEVLNGDAAKRQSLIPTAKATLEKFVKIIQADEVLSVIDGNEYAPDMQVAAPMAAKLQDIAAALG